MLETTLRGARCSHCGKHFMTKWEDVPDPDTGEPKHTQLLVEIKDHT